MFQCQINFGHHAFCQTIAAEQYDRCFYPEGATRQLAAIYATS